MLVFHAPEGKRPLGWPRHRWEDNMKMDFREVGCDTRDWIDLAEDRDKCRTYVRAAGADSEGGQGARAPLSDHTTIIKFSGPMFKYFLH